MLQVTNGTFGYHKQAPLFEDVSFTLEKGEILTILGPNGSGKTTMLKCMTGMLQWQGGQTLLDGRPLALLDRKTLWKKVSYTPQSHKVVFSYTLLEMVLMGRAPYVSIFSAPGLRDYDLARRSLEDVGISHLAEKSFSRISGGEMQLVLIARSLVSEPDILILDEPESHLDFKNQLRVLHLIRELARTKQIICIINTHHPDHALQISDKTLMLGKNKGHMVGKSEQVITEANIETIFGVRVKIVSFHDGEKTRRTIVPLAY